eukprot:CAMPEP_0175717992 /NCGR_PEP_ID=MMETSP0097-20121207/43941_1 /TAXON_ID=311494 /ORGANISM="Alexandrium monilatum, Strain CCMP3105" /LENGTH=294 /DNA_ID=CAMNT_0017025575 /DNA_START=46 /DNA_END=928 /DNA_ORIENTATION=-
METARPPVPPVPRTQRAKPKPNTRGTLAREAARETRECSLTPGESARSGTPPSQCSERRRPREESPFTHARKHSLNREQAKPENQKLPIGDACAGAGAGGAEEHCGNFRRGRGHLDPRTEAGRAGSCPPWSAEVVEASAAAVEVEPGADPPVRSYARQRTLQRERKSADQALEWAPNRAASCDERSHARKNVLDREGEAPGSHLLAADRQQTFTRVLGRHDSEEPRAEGPASYNRRSLLANERRVDGQVETWARVMGRRALLPAPAHGRGVGIAMASRVPGGAGKEAEAGAESH